MIRTRRARRRSGPRRHHTWVELVQTTGPFLSGPVLDRAWPDAMPEVSTEVRARLRLLLAQLRDDRGASRHQLIGAVLEDLLGWGQHLRNDLPDALAEPVLEHSTVVRADFGFYAETSFAEDDPGAEDPSASEADSDSEDSPDPSPSPAEVGPWRLLGLVSPWGSHPLARTSEGGWSASPVERLAHLLRARRVPIGLVTDGRWWTLVWAPVGATVATATWDAEVWSEEPETLAAVAGLLGRSRFLAVQVADTLPELFRESLDRQEEITESLGRQVRDAVELLIGTLDGLDAESGRSLLAELGDDQLYDGVVSFMMRLVFLLFAEERRLLPSDDQTYAEAYSVGRLVEQLEQYAALSGEAALEHRTAAWHRLLAVSRAVHQGVAHEDLRLPAYGGGLFDPDRYPWLEGRVGDGSVADIDAMPPAVDDRTVLAMLRALQYVEVAGERRRLTFRSLDVEQIGYVYEGLLEREVRTATEPMLLLVPPPRGRRPRAPSEVSVSEWETVAEAASARQVEWLVDRTGLSARQAAARLGADATPERRGELLRACGQDAALAEAMAPVFGAVRSRYDGLPAVITPGGRYVAPSLRRAATGTHYTPRSLAEDIADNTLESLVYRPGPLDTSDRSRWRLRPSTDILELRVADIAMGSGAFLVAACRYLADRLVEAWQSEGRADAERALLARQGRTFASDAEIDQVLLDARRLVTEHCLYGVDINPLAVEMAKLSLWLITMDRERPFGFLDDRLRCGDSLLGLVSVDQLATMHIDPVEGGLLHEGSLFDTSELVRPLLQEAADLRRRITAQPVTNVRDVEHKARLLADAEALTGRLAVLADALTGEGLTAAGLRGAQYRSRFVILAARVTTALDSGDHTALRDAADRLLQAGRPAGTSPRQPLHWPLVFPEIFADADNPGFDAIVGNPPFLGGKKISGHLGDDYRAWLQRWDGQGVKGSADLIAFFLLRAERLLSARGQLGIIGVNTLVQGDTLEVGLLPPVSRGLTIRRGRSSYKWPSRSASLEIVNLWASRTAMATDALRWLDGEEVPSIGPDLEPVGNVRGRPQPLGENERICFQGSVVVGLGFTLTHEQAKEFTSLDPRNSEVIRTYVIGKDLNQKPDSSASRCIINFRDWPLGRCEQYPDLIEVLRRLVKPERAMVKRDRHRDVWWQYGDSRPGLYAAIANLDHVLALSLVSNAVMPVRVPTGPVFAHRCGVFALYDFASLALLSSSAHTCWVVRYSSTLETRINYAPSDVFLTLPRPASTPELARLGERLDMERRQLMLSRGWGLTTTYNHVHDPFERDPEVVNLREIHAAIDAAVFAAYGWDDLDPEVGHHKTKIGTRWTISPTVRFEVLDRLLAENHRRYALENGRPAPGSSPAVTAPA